jgi:hypothetical protein
MKSLHAQYIEEREEFQTLETPDGYLTYKDQGNGSFYFRDIFIVPRSRRMVLVRTLFKEAIKIAKENGAVEVYGSVWEGDKKKTSRIKMMIHFGFDYHSYDAEEKLLIFRMAI